MTVRNDYYERPSLYPLKLRKDIPMKETTIIFLTTLEGSVGKTTSKLNLAETVHGLPAGLGAVG